LIQVKKELGLRMAAMNGRDVRFGSKADVTLLNFDVRFTPESGHSPTRSGCLLWAMSGPCTEKRLAESLAFH
jgi:hypothetical protein